MTLARDPRATLSRRTLLARGGLLAVAAAAPRVALARGIEDRFPAVASMVDGFVTQRKLPGVIAAIGEAGAPVQAIARGVRGFGDRTPVTLDSLFRIYSMTKPVTGMAAMVLIDEGKLGLDQPLAEILPRFARMQVQVTPDGPLERVRPARTAITIRHLLTHTAGLGYALVQAGPIRQAMVARGLVAGRVSRLPLPGFDMGRTAPSLAAFADRLAELPLVYEPGARWSYSTSFDLLGRVIEVVAGRPFDAFLRERILEPAGMTSTWFQVPRREAHRLTSNYFLLAGFPVPVDPAATSIFLDRPPVPLGGAGLVSSPRDYDRFLAMLAGFGRIGGRRVISERAVRLATGNLLPPAAVTKGTRIAGHGFGAGGRVGLGPQAGTFGWAGVAGTVGFVDLVRGLRAGFYAQFMPTSVYPVEREFPAAVAADLGRRPRS